MVKVQNNHDIVLIKSTQGQTFSMKIGSTTTDPYLKEFSEPFQKIMHVMLMQVGSR